VNSLETIPLPKNAKTDEDKRIKQQQYDSNKRVRKFQPSWKAVYKWMSNGGIKYFAPFVVTLSLKHQEWARLLKGRTASN
jgi:hypothetical protein